MLDIKFVRDNMEMVQQGLNNRGNTLSLDEFLALEKERRVLLSQVEVLKNKRNTVSQEISQ
jgi:seryl-tRNA synthetase